MSWQMITGIAFLIFSLGINMATLWDHTKHLEQIDRWHEDGIKDRMRLSEAIIKLTDITNSQENRMTHLEDWRNGMDFFNHKRH